MIETLMKLLTRLVVALELMAENSSNSTLLLGTTTEVTGTASNPDVTLTLDNTPDVVAPVENEEPPPAPVENLDRKELIAKMTSLAGDNWNKRIRDPKLIKAIDLLEAGDACAACNGTGTASKGGACSPCGGTGVGNVTPDAAKEDGEDDSLELPDDDGEAAEEGTVDRAKVRALIMEIIQEEDDKTKMLEIIKIKGNADRFDDVDDKCMPAVYASVRAYRASIKGGEENLDDI